MQQNDHCESTGKRCYRSETHARKVMKRLSARLRIYRCRDCGKFHMTKMTG